LGSSTTSKPASSSAAFFAAGVFVEELLVAAGFGGTGGGNGTTFGGAGEALAGAGADDVTGKSALHLGHFTFPDTPSGMRSDVGHLVQVTTATATPREDFRSIDYCYLRVLANPRGDLVCFFISSHTGMSNGGW
jgi:hypothetical protein